MAQQDRSGRGQAKDPKNDGRTKQGKGGGRREGDVQPGGQGRVKNPREDGRLKENR